MSSFRVLGVLRAAPVLLAVACSGQIGDVDGSGAGPTGGSGTTGGTGSTGSGSGTTGGTGTSSGGSGTTSTGTAGTSTGGTGMPGFMGPLLSQPGVSARFSRLTHPQWENAVKDLLRLTAPLGLSGAFVAEPLQSTFNTNSQVLNVQKDLWEDYQTAAEAVASKVVKDAKLLPSVLPATPADAAGKTKAFITSFGQRVFRRPLTDDEVTRYTALFNKGATLIASGNALNDGVEITISAFLQSPHFLYRTELGSTVAAGRILLSDYEVASKLSFALLNTMPDDALFTAAAAGQLHSRDTVLQQAQRIIALPAVENTVSDFHDQLMRMRDFDSIKKDEKTFPLFVAAANADIRQESLSFVKNVIFDQDRGFQELFSAPYTFANNRVKQMYGKPTATPDAFSRLELDPTQHAGILTDIGFLAANGEGDMPNIIMRGVHVAKDILCVDIPPPPDMVPMLPPAMPGQTNRQRVQTLTMNQPCASCHGVFINPIGFAFENLNGVGKWRTTEPGGAIDAKSSYTLDDKPVSFDGPVELSKLIAGSQQANACYARHWAEYLYGRPLDLTSQADQNLITDAGLISKNVPSAKQLILNLVATESFLARLP
jgi:hypothetical protein